jgi:hypothetical protein
LKIDDLGQELLLRSNASFMCQELSGKYEATQTIRKRKEGLTLHRRQWHGIRAARPLAWHAVRPLARVPLWLA